MIFRAYQYVIFMSETISTLFSTLWEVWKEMAGAVWAILSKVFFFFLWALCGVIILPCVYVAGTLFPMWQEWGEGF